MAGTKSPRVLYPICSVLVGLLFCGHVAHGGASLFEPSPTDLELSAAEETHSRALGHFGVGLLYVLEENPSATALAEQHLRAALRLAPQSPLVAEALIYPLLMRRDFLGVVEELRPIAAAHPGEAHLVLLMAEAYESAEQPDAAIDCLRQGLVDGAWSSGRIIRRLFALLWQRKRYDEAETLLRQAGHKPVLRNTFDYHYAAALHGNVSALRATRDGASARRQRRLRAAVADHACQAADRADTGVESEDIGAVVDLLIEADRWPQACALLERLADEYDSPDLWLLKARALTHSGRTAEAGAYLAELITRYLPEECLGEAARILIGATNPPTAARAFQRYLTMQPDSVPARFQLACIYYGDGQAELGLRTLEPIRDLSPECLMLRAYLHQQLHQTDLALAAAEQAEMVARATDRTDFPTADSHLFVSSLREKCGDLPGAIQAARQALALTPDDPACANYVGYLLADQNQELPTAESLIRRAVAADMNNAAYLDSLAWVLYRQGRFGPALDAILQALALDQDGDAVLFDHAGDICAALQLTDLARFYWTRALATEVPKPEAVRQKIAGLGSVDSAASTRYVP